MSTLDDSKKFPHKMKKLEVFVVLTVILSVESRRRFIKQMKFKDDVDELIETAGYCGEIHEVPTKDGYLLKVHRILPKREAKEPKKPVFLMHGLFSTAAEYVLTGPEVSLAFLLSIKGYDVWMGNARGSKHSMVHKTLNPESKEFWNFSWHEMGIYDLPAMIDYMLNVTNETNCYYVGHSEGTTSLLVLLSELPQYNQKIIQAHLMATTAILKSVSNPTLMFLKTYLTNDVVTALGFFKSPPFMKLFEALSSIFCTENLKPTLMLCQNLISNLFGRNKKDFEIDSDILSEIIQHVSQYISMKQLVHFLQSMLSGKFRKFDYKNMNMKFYNATVPPEYNIQSIIVPIYLYHAAEDALVSQTDIANLKKKLLNVRELRIIKNWNHIDFNYGKNSRKVLFNDIVKSLNSEGIK